MTLQIVLVKNVPVGDLVSPMPTITEHITSLCGLHGENAWLYGFTCIGGFVSWCCLSDESKLKALVPVDKHVPQYSFEYSVTSVNSQGVQDKPLPLATWSKVPYNKNRSHKSTVCASTSDPWLSAPIHKVSSKAEQVILFVVSVNTSTCRFVHTTNVEAN
jgi:hypothetical protein